MEAQQMNDIDKLINIAGKETRTIIGLMSGTSVDGLDIALCKFSGFGLDTKFSLLHFESITFPNELRNQILNFLGKKMVDLEELTLLNTEFAIFTAQAVLYFLQKNNIPSTEVDLISSHGQTVFHAPKSFHKYPNRPNATLQIGDGDHIAAFTGIITIADLRQKHVAKGGEGAPLALYADYALFSSKDENRVLLNIGGISNFTFLPMDKSQGCWATDVGPGNTLIDELCRKYYFKNFDENGKIGASGKVNKTLLVKLQEHPYLQITNPKTTGQEGFNLKWFEQVLSQIGDLPAEDQICTASHFTAITIAKDINLLQSSNVVVYVSGGGANNAFLISLLSDYLNKDITLQSFDKLGISGEAKEAVLFAFLANENFAKTSTIYPFEPSNLKMGKICLPN